MKKLLTIFAFLLFAIPFLGKAEEVIEQIDGSYTSASSTISLWGQSLGTSTASTTINRATIRINWGTSTPAELRFTMRRCEPVAESCYWSGTADIGNFPVTSTISRSLTAPSGIEYTFIFPSSTHLENASSQHYLWTIQSTSTPFKLIGSIDPNSYPNGSLRNGVGTGNLTEDSIIKDAYFRLFFEADTNDAINIISPPDGGSTADFGLWGIEWKQATTTTNFSEPHYSAKIIYGDNPNNLIFSDSEPLRGVTAGISSTASIQKTNLTATSTIYAQARLYFGNELVANSAIISFSLTSVGNPYFPSISSTIFALSDDVCQFTTSTFLTDPLGVFQTAICRSLTFLFVPNDTALNQYDNLKTALENKPPFGYFSAVSSTLSGLGTATSSLNFAGFGDLGTQFFTPVKNALALILWVFLAFYFIERFRHFEI